MRHLSSAGRSPAAHSKPAPLSHPTIPHIPTLSSYLSLLSPHISLLQALSQDTHTFTQPLLLVLSKILIVFHKRRLPFHSSKQDEVKSSQEQIYSPLSVWMQAEILSKIKEMLICTWGFPKLQLIQPAPMFASTARFSRTAVKSSSSQRATPGSFGCSHL